MLSNNILDIRNDILRTKKAIVALGCSFVQGSELSDNHTIKNHSTFLNVLCKEHLGNVYTPINFGQGGAGNFSAISRLFLYDIPWKKLDEIIVVFMPTGMQRYDIIRDENTYGIGTEFKTIWPYTVFEDPTNGWEYINKGYEESCYSKKFEVLNTILSFQFLNSWVAEHSARLVVFPAFSKEYTKEYFLKNLSVDIHRNKNMQIESTAYGRKNHYDYRFLINQVPWNKFITIQDKSTFYDLCFSQDINYDKRLTMQKVIDGQLMNNNDWIMPKGHPSANGHRLLAEELSKILSLK
jgi:hypothetical protein